ncbi:MAG: hypothetical protein QNK23_02100 [Crocinitomicaceae bacterium]|nr:hypothetical protein [Crocinitomicaceae bacterium]
MEEKKHILKKGGLEAGAGFTSKLMEQINAEETALSNVLSKHGAEQPSVDFTAQLMSQLEGKTPKVPYTPVISKRTWIGIAAAFIGVFILTMFSGGEASGRLNPETLQTVKDTVSGFFSNGSLFTYLILGALLLSLALFLDQGAYRKTES